MFKSLLKKAFRNITHKYGYSFLNILGMTLGITSAIFFILIPTALTVSFQSYKAATANPAESIWTE